MNKFSKRLMILTIFSIFSNPAFAQGHGGLPESAAWLVIILFVIFFVIGLFLIKNLVAKIASKDKQ